MHLSKLGYYADFVVYPLSILGLLATLVLQIERSQAGALRPVTVIGLCVLGAAIWTLFEYVLHRHVLHRVPILHDMHEVHHADPSAFVGTPSWLSLSFFVALAFVPLCYLFGFQPAGALTAGLMFGYLCYVGVHHISHHWRLTPGTMLYALKHRHARHHFAKTPGNFGVTTRFWDRVFRTSLDGSSKARRS